MRVSGGDPKKTIKIKTTDDISKFYIGEIAVWTGYTQAEPVEAQLAGYDVREILAYDYGSNDYAGFIVTRTDIVAGKPELARAFLSASLRGWDRAIRNPDDGIEAILYFQPLLSATFQKRALSKLTTYVHTGIVPIGWIYDENMKRSCDDWQISQPESIYTTRFLRDVYNEIFFDTDNVLMAK
jgi:ABC-type nitrate/sulfonate/bicarbonate transport system substrate-binding protein